VSADLWIRNLQLKLNYMKSKISLDADRISVTFDICPCEIVDRMEL